MGGVEGHRTFCDCKECVAARLRPAAASAPDLRVVPDPPDDDDDERFDDLPVVPTVRRSLALEGERPDAAAIARVLGAARGETTFACPLHLTASRATVTMTEGGYAQMRCACGHEERQRAIGQAFAALHYGDDVPEYMSKVQRGVWAKRLLWEAAGRPRMEWVKVAALEGEAPAWLLKARRGYVLHRTLWQSMREVAELPSAFAQRFVMAWCDLSRYEAEQSIKRLSEAGVIVRVNPPKKRIALYRPGP